jgi:hypothetical protein
MSMQLWLNVLSLSSLVFHVLQRITISQLFVGNDAPAVEKLAERISRSPRPVRSRAVHLCSDKPWILLMQALVLCHPSRLSSVDVATRCKGCLWESLQQGINNTAWRKAGQGWP